MLVAVSFCNNERRPERGLLVYDLEKSKGTWLPVGCSNPIMGTRGTCTAGSQLYTTYTIGWSETRIAWYEASADSPTLVGDVPLAEVVDPHSICIFDDTLLVASTGTDEIIAYRLKDGAPEASGETFWRAGSERADIHHVNGICTDGKRVLVSAFGRSNGEHWRSAEHGFVCDATTGTTIFEDIYHPHSVRIFGGIAYVVESSRQCVWSDAGEKIIIGGYARGLDLTRDGHLLVGTNAARRVSRSRGSVLNLANPENQEGRVVGAASLVRIASMSAVRREFFDLSTFGPEIYDVCALDL